MTESEISDAYVRIRRNDSVIPDNVLDFMKDASIKVLNENKKGKCPKCNSENIVFSSNKTTVDVNASGNYRKIVFDYCEDCEHGINVEFFN